MGKTTSERKQEALERWARERRGGGANETSAELRTALNNPVQQQGLTLAAQAAAFKGTAKEASVALVIELRGSDLEFAPQSNGLLADTIEVSFFALDDDGRAQRGTRSALNLAVRPETYQRVKTGGLRLNARTTMSPGRYQMRIGARDPNTGKSGTVFYDVIVPDFGKDPFMMSGLLLSSPPATPAADVLTPQRDPALEKLLGAPATSRRDFTRAESLTWMTELYDNSPAKQARQFDVSTRLLDETGREVFASRDAVKNGESGAQRWQTFACTGRIPLADIPPGQYLLRIEALDRSIAAKEPAVAQTVITVR